MSISSTTKAASTMRITGMATGMDTDAMVKAMTANIQNKIDKANQEKQIGQWKQEMYQDIIKDVKGLQDYFNPTSSKYILGSSKFNPIKVTNSNEGAVGFTASSTAQEGNYKINISKLAEPAIVKNESVSKTDSTLSTKLQDIDSNFKDSKLTFTINDTINIPAITVSDTTTIKNVIDTINNNADVKSAKISASFDELSKKIIFTTNETGSDKNLKVKVTDDNATLDLTSKLGFEEGKTYSDLGENANFNITYPDGRTETIATQSTNQFTANGITYNLKAAGTGTTTINVTKNNVDTIVENLTKFKDDYNDLIDKIQGKLTEKKQFSYKPLTDAQKENMKDADIKNWETKAKKGLLKNDSNLENLLGDLKSAFADNVFSSFDTSKDPYNQDKANKLSLHVGSFDASSIGIDTSSDTSSLGKIEIKDETKLKNAISNHIEEFTKLFIGKSNVTRLEVDPVTKLEKPYKGSEKYYEDGIFTRMDNIIRNYAGDPGIGKDGTSTVKGVLNIFANKQYDYSISGYSSKNTLPDQIYGKTRLVNTLTDKLNDAQDRYYKKFAALEKAMNNMNSQMSKFQSQMG